MAADSTLGIANSTWTLAAGGLLEAFLAYHFIRLFRTLWIMTRTPTYKALQVTGEKAGKFIEVSGKAVPTQRAIAPISGKPAVYYRVFAEESQTRTTGEYGQHSASRQIVVYNDELRVPFYVEDDTGKILINPEKAEVMVHPKKEIRLPKNDPAVAKFLRGLPEQVRNGLMERKSVKFIERTIAEGEDTFVLGVARQSDRGGMVIENGSPMMLVTNDTEKSMTQNIKIGLVFLFVVMAIVLVFILPSIKI